MPPITGRPGEVTLVMEEALYNGPLGDSLYAFICQEELALPQSGYDGAEPMFDLTQIPPASFGNMFRANRNIIIVTIDSKLEEAVFRIEEDYWAKHQLLIRLAAPSKEQLAVLIYERGDFLVETMRETEVKREIFFNNKFENTELKNHLISKHQISMQFQKGWQKKMDTDDFVWMTQTPQNVQQHVLIKTYPYNNEKQISFEGLLIDTEKWLKEYVPGPSDGSYMCFEIGQAPIYSRVFEKDGIYIREIKGLWKVQNDFMGGPFISWSFIDQERNRLVTVLGQVYAPKTDKRNHIRRVESILHTVIFPDQE